MTFDDYDAFCIATGHKKAFDLAEGRGHRPVICVSWYDAVEYCNWLSKIEGLQPCYTIDGSKVACDFAANGYRLPTVAEWNMPPLADSRLMAIGTAAATIMMKWRFIARLEDLVRRLWGRKNQMNLEYTI